MTIISLFFTTSNIKSYTHYFEDIFVTRTKKIILPIIILVAGVGLLMAFSSMKKPPEEKAKIDNTPIVAVENISVIPMTLKVHSYGVVTPKYETELVAQVNGQIVELSESFVRGGFIKKGQLLARIDPNDFKAALIEAQASMASARAALQTERAQGQVAEREWKYITDTSPTELSLRKPQLAQELARVKAAQAAVLRAERNLERTQIRAPYDAMIESRAIGLGSFVGVGSQIGKLLGTAIAQVRLPVADNQLQFLVNHGNDAVVEIKGVYAGKNRLWTASIARSEGVIDNVSRMSYLVAEIHDPYLLESQHVNKDPIQSPLRFGSYITADILGIKLQQASIIPRYLVVNNRVPVFDADSTLRYAEIDIVRQDGRNVIVSQGLSDGEQLIVSALDYPVNGMKLALIGSKVEPDEDNADKDNQTDESEEKDKEAQVASVESN
jgi:RND family efflux transporter MFP subunit